MTGEQPKDPADVLFICSLEDLNCLHDYMVAAMAGDDLSELPRLWNQQIGVIRSRPHPAPAQGTSKLCFGTITLIAEECRKCNEIEACKQKQSVIDYQKREIAAEAARKAREDVLQKLADPMKALIIAIGKTYDESMKLSGDYNADLGESIQVCFEKFQKLREAIESLRSTQQQAGDQHEQ